MDKGNQGNLLTIGEYNRIVEFEDYMNSFIINSDSLSLLNDSDRDDNGWDEIQELVIQSTTH